MQEKINRAFSAAVLSHRPHRLLYRVTLLATSTLSRAFPQADKDRWSLRLTRAQREADCLRAALWSNGINPVATVGNPSSAATARIVPKAARQREKKRKAARRHGTQQQQGYPRIVTPILVSLDGNDGSDNRGFRTLAAGRRFDRDVRNKKRGGSHGCLQ